MHADLCIVVFYIFHYIAYLTVKYLAKNLNRVSADAFVSLEACYLRRADIIFLYESILCYTLVFHRLPQIFIRNHNIQASLST